MVGIYCRISGDKEEGKDTSIETQEESGIAFAKSLNNGKGMPYKLYYDIGVSGKAEIEKRDDFSKFIKDIKNGIITKVYAINQARIERNPDTWRYFVAHVVKYSIKWYPNGIYYDLNNTINRGLASILSIMNEMHSELTSDAVKIAFEKNARKGKGHGIRAYGITYDKDGYMVQHTKEIEVVKDIFKWSLDGLGAYSIAKKLNAMNVPTRFAKLGKNFVTTDASTGKKVEHKNKVWWGSTVHGILKKKLYAGIHVWNGEEIPLPHLAIISLKEYDAVQKNLKKNKRTKSGKTPIYKYLMNGLLYCAECGHMYKGKRRLADRRNQYLCVGKQPPLHVCKTSKGFNIPRFETFIIKHLFLNKDLQEHLNNIEVDTIEIDTLTFKKNELIKKLKAAEKLETKAFNYLFDDGDDDNDLSGDARLKAKYIEAKDKVAKYKEALERVESELAIQSDNNRLNRVNNTIEGFDVNAGFETIKMAIQQLVERIDIHYQPREKNGIFIFKIKYYGFNEFNEYAATQQLDRFACINFYKKPDPAVYGEKHAKYGFFSSKNEHFLKHETNFNEYFDKFYSQHKMPVRVAKDELIIFN